jgi:cysteine desulfurase
VDVQKEHIDLLCLSAHKFYGPKGIGALFIRRRAPRVTLFPQIDGGGHERGLRSGTLNVPGIVALGSACELATNEMNEDAKRIGDLRNRMERKLLAVSGSFLNGSVESRLYNTLNICFAGIRSESLINKIPNIALAMGSACTSAIPEPSHVLKAMGLSDDESYGSVRLSLGKFTTEEEIELVADSIINAIENLRSKPV